MMLITLPWLVLVCIFAALAARWALNIFQSSRWLTRNTNETKKGNRRVVVIIPLLNEQERIPATAKYFMKTFDNLTLLLVTTAAEGKTAWTSSADVARKLSEKYPRIIHVHYNGKGRKMASQLNAAISFLRMKRTSPDTLIAIYNADSQPNKDTFLWVQNHPEKGTGVFQQYGAYWKNNSSLSRTPSGATLLAAAAWQTRWSMGFEIPHARAQDKNRRASGMNYCIGHGLLFQLRNFELFGPFDEKAHNEDAILGLELSYKRVPIIPVPRLERAESPDLLSGWFTQQASWFYGPWQAPSYYRCLAQKLQLRVFTQRARLAWLTAQLFSHAVYWLCGPILLLLMLLLGVRLGTLQFTISIAVALLYTGGINYLALSLAGEQSGAFTAFSLIFGSLIQYLLHGFAAYYALIRSASYRIAGKTIPKTRTVMSNGKKTLGA